MISVAFYRSRLGVNPVQLLCLLLGLSLAAAAAAVQAGADSGPQQCLECHDYGEDSPVHPLLAGSHGMSLEGSQGRACLNCHGASEAHLRAPRRNSPDVSFGPRWSSNPGAQDLPCLECHEQNTAHDWRNALHMHNNLTCITCHDIHASEDRVLIEEQQAQVCEVCHKVQKQGVHGLERRKKRNPPCTLCHNPHDHEDAHARMLENRSAGCITCHDPARMANSSRVSPKAKSYHKVMNNAERTCIDCHDGIAHAPADSAPPMHPEPVTSRSVTLFYPGMTTSDWLLHSHPGAQPLQQGFNCTRCHRGEEVQMGEALADNSVAVTARGIEVAVSRQDGWLQLNITWEGPEDDALLSLMWGDRSVKAVAQGGCFAACHSDMRGMSAERATADQKYLAISRLQQRQIGRPAIVRDATELEQLVAQGSVAEIWRLNLATGALHSAGLLAGTAWEASDLMQVNKTYHEGHWRVVLRRRLDHSGSGLRFTTERKYTFGIALNGAENGGGKHWVSLPLTLSFGGEGTDFTAK